MCDKRDRAITCTCMFFRDLHLTLMISGLLQKDCVKEGEVWRKDFSNNIIVTSRLSIQGLPSSFLSRPVA